MPVVQEESGFTFIVNKLHLYSYFMPRLRSLWCCGARGPTAVFSWTIGFTTHIKTSVSALYARRSQNRKHSNCFLFFKHFTWLSPLFFFLLLFCFCVTWESLSSCRWNRSDKNRAHVFELGQKLWMTSWNDTKAQWAVLMSLLVRVTKVSKRQLLVSRRASSNGL